MCGQVLYFLQDCVNAQAADVEGVESKPWNDFLSILFGYHSKTAGRRFSSDYCQMELGVEHLSSLSCRDRCRGGAGPGPAHREWRSFCDGGVGCLCGGEGAGTCHQYDLFCCCPEWRPCGGGAGVV